MLQLYHHSLSQIQSQLQKVRQHQHHSLNRTHHQHLKVHQHRSLKQSQITSQLQRVSRHQLHNQNQIQFLNLIENTNKNKKEYKISKNSEVYVTSDSAEVKKENNYESSKITTLLRNTVLKVLEIEDDWCKIFYDGQYGWIKTENLASIYSNPNYNINQENKNIIYIDIRRK